MPPLLSVVIPSFNQGRFIGQTLASVFGQNWPRLEVIVIDGGSTDETRTVVERYPVQHFISEKDGGQSDALNKGFRLARGDVLAWLCSDDYYLPLAVERGIAALGPDLTQPALVYGECLQWYEQEGRAKVGRTLPFRPETLQTNNFIVQPSTFWTRALWEKTGELEAGLHFAMDWDFWLRASQHCTPQPLPECLSVYRFHGDHKSARGGAQRTREILSLVERHASPEWIAAYQAVAGRLESMGQSWRRGSYRWHKLRHLDLYLRHGSKVDTAFWQLHL